LKGHCGEALWGVDIASQFFRTFCAFSEMALSPTSAATPPLLPTSTLRSSHWYTWSGLASFDGPHARSLELMVIKLVATAAQPLPPATKPPPWRCKFPVLISS